MRRHPLLLAAALAAATLVAACGGGSPTLPPLPPEATNRPSVEPAGIPSDHPSIGPSAAASAAPSPVEPAPVTAAPPTPVGGQEQPELVLVALNIVFEPTELTVPAGAPFTIGLDNRDTGVPHNLEVFGLDGTSLVRSEIIMGPAQQVVSVPALAPGSYRFTCTVHPNMVGTITAE